MEVQQPPPHQPAGGEEELAMALLGLGAPTLPPPAQMITPPMDLDTPPHNPHPPTVVHHQQSHHLPQMGTFLPQAQSGYDVFPAHHHQQPLHIQHHPAQEPQIHPALLGLLPPTPEADTDMSYTGVEVDANVERQKLSPIPRSPPAPSQQQAAGLTLHQILTSATASSQPTQSLPSTAPLPQKRKRPVSNGAANGTHKPKQPKQQKKISHILPEDNTLIRCICGLSDDDGFTIQCETCFGWIHAACVGIISEEAVPDIYICYLCNPAAGPLIDPVLARAKQEARLALRARELAASTSETEFLHASHPPSPSTQLHQPNSSKPVDPHPKIVRKPKPKQSQPRASMLNGLKEPLTTGSPSSGPSNGKPSSSTSQSNGLVLQSPLPDFNPSSFSLSPALALQQEDFEDFRTESWSTEYAPIRSNVVREPQVKRVMAELIRQRAAWKGKGKAYSDWSYDPVEVRLEAGKELDDEAKKISVRQLVETSSCLPNSFLYSASSASASSASTSRAVYPRPSGYAIFSDSTQTIMPEELICEYRGVVIPASAYRNDPINQYRSLGVPKPHVRNVLLPDEMGMDFVVDARGEGNESRWVRSGCHPNARLRPIILLKSQGNGRISEEDEVEITFGIFATTEILKRDEIILPWEWDDAHIIHSLLELMEEPHPFILPQTSELRFKIDTVLTHMLGCFSSCACEKKKDCIISQYTRLLEGKGFLGIGEKGGKRLKRPDLGRELGLRRGWRRREEEAERLAAIEREKGVEQRRLKQQQEEEEKLLKESVFGLGNAEDVPLSSPPPIHSHLRLEDDVVMEDLDDSGNISDASTLTEPLSHLSDSSDEDEDDLLSLPPSNTRRIIPLSKSKTSNRTGAEKLVLGGGLKKKKTRVEDSDDEGCAPSSPLSAAGSSPVAKKRWPTSSISANPVISTQQPSPSPPFNSVNELKNALVRAEMEQALGSSTSVSPVPQAVIDSPSAPLEMEVDYWQPTVQSNLVEKLPPVIEKEPTPPPKEPTPPPPPPPVPVKRISLSDWKNRRKATAEIAPSTPVVPETVEPGQDKAAPAPASSEVKPLLEESAVISSTPFAVERTDPLATVTGTSTNLSPAALITTDGEAKPPLIPVLSSSDRPSFLPPVSASSNTSLPTPPGSFDRPSFLGPPVNTAPTRPPEPLTARSPMPQSSASSQSSAPSFISSQYVPSLKMMPFENGTSDYLNNSDKTLPRRSTVGSTSILPNGVAPPPTNQHESASTPASRMNSPTSQPSTVTSRSVDPDGSRYTKGSTHHNQQQQTPLSRISQPPESPKAYGTQNSYSYNKPQPPSPAGVSRPRPLDREENPYSGDRRPSISNGSSATPFRFGSGSLDHRTSLGSVPAGPRAAIAPPSGPRAAAASTFNAVGGGRSSLPATPGVVIPKGPRAMVAGEPVRASIWDRQSMRGGLSGRGGMNRGGFTGTGGR